MLQNLHLTFVFVNKSKVEISQNFVVFSEYMNFKTEILSLLWHEENKKSTDKTNFRCLVKITYKIGSEQ
jgi:hypothetical protein